MMKQIEYLSLTTSSLTTSLRAGEEGGHQDPLGEGGARQRWHAQTQGWCSFAAFFLLDFEIFIEQLLHNHKNDTDEAKIAMKYKKNYIKTNKECVL